jgi:hypothetical protein
LDFKRSRDLSFFLKIELKRCQKQLEKTTQRKIRIKVPALTYF